MNYSKAKVQQALNLEHNDCTVKAIAIACDVAYRVAHRALANAGRPRRDGCYPRQQQAAIEALGFEIEYIHFSAKTVKTLASDPVVAKGHYMAWVRGHVFAVKNGKVEDWTEGRKHRIQSVGVVRPAASRKARAEMQRAVFN